MPNLINLWEINGINHIINLTIELKFIICRDGFFQTFKFSN